MATSKFVSYLRVSTERQGASGLGLEAQRRAVVEHVNGHGTLLAEYVEVESGKRADRPQLGAALAHAKATGATLVVAKLDRLARNLHFITSLMEAGCEFVACDMPAANKLTIHILAAVAESEREAISARTKAALAAAKARGTRLGNPNGVAGLRGYGNGAAVDALRAKADEHAARVLPIVRTIRSEGVGSLRGIAAELDRRGIRTARGGTWNATRVRMLLARSAG